MNNKATKQALSNIRAASHSHHISVAVNGLKKLMAETKLWDYAPQIDNLDMSYRYMMNYMLENGRDPGRDKFVADMTDSLDLLADRMERDIEAVDSPNLYYARVRTDRLSPDNPAGLITRYVLLSDSADDKRDKEQTLIQIFNKIWTTFPLQSGELSLLTATASDETKEPALRSQIVSALLLGALEYYERGRFEALIDIYNDSASLSVKAQALMALVIALYANHDRAATDGVLTARLAVWCGDNNNVARLRTVIMEIVRALDTERINKTLKEDFIPMIDKLKPGIDKMMKEGGISEDGDFNPEWEEMMANSGLDKKLQELTELQEEGADLMMFAFSNLKSFGFFRELSNWFLPFDARHSSISGDDTSEPLSTAILETPGMMCDSDKYSFVLSLLRTPEAQRKMMLSQFQAQEEAVRDAINAARLQQTDASLLFKQECVRYIRNLNRFFKLFREHTQFKDVLHHPFSLTAIPILGYEVLKDAAWLRVIGEFYLRRGYWRDALEMFRLLEESEGSDSALLEKIGYCLQKLGDNVGAYSEYRKAELFNPDSLWLIKHIAQTARLTGRYADAAEYYTRILEREPENLTAMLHRAASLFESGNHAEALKMYYEIAYLHPDNIKALRAIAWIEMVNGNIAKSLSYHERILTSGHADTSDYINTGHARLIEGDVKGAVDEYRRAIDTVADKAAGVAKVVDTITNDRDNLMLLGVDAIDIDLICDYLTCI